MRRRRLAIVIVAILVVIPHSAPAQAGSVYDLIPEDALGYIATANMGRTLDRAEKFLVDAGMAEVLGLSESPDLRSLLTDQARFGDGIDWSGGGAFVLLDPAKFGLTAADVFGGNVPEAKIPVVVLVPGSRVEGVFPAAVSDDDKKYARLSGEGLWLLALGDYVAVSPNTDALDQIAAVKPGASAGAEKLHKALIDKSDVVAHVNMEATRPLLSQGLKMAGTMLNAARQFGGDQEGSEALGMELGALMLPVLGDLLEQVGSATAGARIDEIGLVIENAVDLQEGSNLARLLTSMPALEGGDGLSKAPNLEYVMAMAVNMPTDRQALEWLIAGQEALLKTILEAAPLKMDAGALKKMTAVGRKSLTTLTGMRFVYGAAPEGHGMMNYSYLFETRDAAELLELQQENMVLAEKMVGAMTAAEGGDEAEAPKMTYRKSVVEVEGVSADAIEMSLPGAGPMQQQMFSQMFGEEGLRMYLAPARKESLVMTLGGGKEMLSRAIKRARKPKRFLQAEEAPAVLKALPPEPSFLWLLSMHNYAEQINRMMQAMPFGPSQEFKLPAEAPVAVSLGADDNTLRGAVVVPAKVIHDSIGLWLQVESARPAPNRPAPPAPDSEDF